MKEPRLGLIIMYKPNNLLKIYVFVEFKLKRQCHFSIIQAIISKILNQPKEECILPIDFFRICYNCQVPTNQSTMLKNWDTMQ